MGGPTITHSNGEKVTKEHSEISFRMFFFVIYVECSYIYCYELAYFLRSWMEIWQDKGDLQRMESSIIVLDEHTDQATKQMLQHVVDRKRKFETLQRKHRTIMWITVSIATLFFVYLYLYVFIPYSYSFFTIFSVFVNQFSHLFFLVCTIGLYGYLTIVKNKMEKAEKEYQLLRCEIIQKSKLLWENESEWKNRHKVFEMMKNNFDINLYHENK